MKKDKKIKLIIVDFNGVISLGSFKDLCQWIAKKYPYTFAEAYDIVYHKYFSQAALGKMTEEEFFATIVQALGLKEDWQWIRAKHLSFMKFNRPAQEFFRGLQKRGYKILILSKNTKYQLDYLLRKFKTRWYFKNVINTLDLGLPKASRETIEYILKKFKVRPEETIMIDDQDFNLVEAEKMGVKTLLYENLAGLKKELKNIV